LLGSRFSVDALSKQGVRYLTRNEEQEARDKANLRFNLPDVWGIKDTDQESVRFLQEVRVLIEHWVAHGQVKSPS
jgi:hypothetical protein